MVLMNNFHIEQSVQLCYISMYIQNDWELQTMANHGAYNSISASAWWLEKGMFILNMRLFFKNDAAVFHNYSKIAYLLPYKTSDEA